MAVLSTSFIVPVYNEAHRVSDTLGHILAFVEARPEPSEVIFVNDGSTDATAELVRQAIEGRPAARLVSYAPNRGKGGAIREGMRAARHDIVFFMDVDLATDLAVADAFLARFADPAVDIVIGTRSAPGATVVKHQPWLRERLGKVFTWLSNLVVPGVSDFTCGFKAFRREVGRVLFDAGVVDDWSFDTEILYLARLGGYPLAELPVSWHDVGGTKVRVLRNGLVCLRQLAALPLRRAAGRYRGVAGGRAARASVGEGDDRRPQQA